MRMTIMAFSVLFLLGGCNSTAHRLDYTHEHDALVFPRSEIHDAAKLGDLKKVEALLKGSPDLVVSKDNYGFTPLHEAVIHGHKSVAELLLASKADVNAKNKDGLTPMRIAVLQGRKDLVELLFLNKADYSIHDAAALGDLERIDALLKAKTDMVFSKDEDGITPLHYAAMYGHKDAVELLLAGKADVNAKDNHHMTPLGYVTLEAFKNVAITELLRQHGGHE